MKNIYYFLFILLLLFSCTKDDTVSNNNQTPKNNDSLIIITGSVKDFSGNIIVNAGIKFNDSLFVNTDSLGNFKIRGIQPGNYTIVASKKGFSSDTIGVALHYRDSLNLIFQIYRLTKKVLIELSTNVNCINSPPSENFLNLIDSAYSNITISDTSVIILTMHSSVFPADPFYYFNVPVNSARQYYYSISLNPAGYLNGSLLPAYNSQTWINYLDSGIANYETQSISISNILDSVSRNGTLYISINQLLGNTSNDLRLHAAIVESKLYYGSGSNGQKWFNNVLRDFITGPNGQSISLPYSSSINYTLKNGISISNSRLIVFTQSQSTKEVFAVKKIKL